MVEFLVPRGRGRPSRVSDRKVRLFEVACCRRIWHVIPEGPGRDAVLVAERFADGAASDRARRAARNRAADAIRDGDLVDVNAGYAAFFTTEKTCGKRFYMRSAAVAVARAARMSGQRDVPEAYRAALRAEEEAQAALARCVFGNPFRCVAFDQAWRTSTVQALATAAYAERILPSGQLDPARLAILADALEEAGCFDEAILAHLRGPGPHVRGCHPVDLILGKG
jgi:hypothetical protein